MDMLVDFFDRQPALVSERSRLVAAINDLAHGFRSFGQLKEEREWARGR